MSKFWNPLIKQLEPYVPGEQLDDPAIIKLNTNENPFPPSPKVLEAIQEESVKLQLYPSPSVDELREEIASYYSLKKEQVFVGNGSDEVLAFSFMTFFEPGKTIKYPDITYSFYPAFAKLYQLDVEEVPLGDDFSLPVEAFFQSEGGVIFPNPNAPSSLYVKMGAIEEILKNNPDQVVIIDEAYVDFAEASAVSLIDSYPNLLVVQTLSKSRSLAGLRVGLALGHPDLIEGLTRAKDSFNSYTMDRLAIVGAMEAFKDTAYFEKTKQEIITVREYFRQELEKRNFYVLPSQTNFVLASPADIEAEKLFTQLKQEGFLIRYFNQPKLENYVRISIGTKEQMNKLLDAIDKIIEN
ncbi:histidinol-phosphate transaminase [Oceanobacillus neutriphilus]|uniref:Histidinol-phosphate aminotransferase n=1 Tax=Oceanobacillus neutriphilus TaxID=531815 RepID=A0ABQ2P094_9BACI|nr:histidinol-phosphate transaminase [Oceanobacillus neutriphilus]GGP14947.1 histidinol-phosphate aminotransferase [Oceanobacillus neutriphilus]